MISSSEIQRKIAIRARGQFYRDIKQIENFLITVDNEITISEVIFRARQEAERAQKIKKKSWLPFLGFGLNVNETTEEDYINQFLLKFMSKLGVESLSVDELKDVNLMEIYMLHFKDEYEDYQAYMYETLDAKIFNRGVVLGSVNLKSADTDEAENC